MSLIIPQDLLVYNVCVDVEVPFTTRIIVTIITNRMLILQGFYKFRQDLRREFAKTRNIWVLGKENHALNFTVEIFQVGSCPVVLVQQ